MKDLTFKFPKVIDIKLVLCQVEFGYSAKQFTHKIGNILASLLSLYDSSLTQFQSVLNCFRQVVYTSLIILFCCFVL